MTVLLIMGHATDALQFENALRLQLPYCAFVVGILLFLFDFVHPQVHLGHDRVIQYFVDEAIGHRQRVFLSVGVTNLPRISINLSRLQSSRLQCFCLLHKVQIMAEHRRDLLEVWMGTTRTDKAYSILRNNVREEGEETQFATAGIQYGHTFAQTNQDLPCD